jgi:hypothetical protein
VDPVDVLGLTLGEAAVIRNVGVRCSTGIGSVRGEIGKRGQRRDADRDTRDKKCVLISQERLS